MNTNNTNANDMSTNDTDTIEIFISEDTDTESIRISISEDNDEEVSCISGNEDEKLCDKLYNWITTKHNKPIP